MSTVIKKIKGRSYIYFQRSERIAGKVVTTSIYLGPLNPLRRKNGLGWFAGGVASMAVKAAKGELKPYTHHRERQSLRTNPTPGRPLTEDQWAVHRSTMSADAWSRYMSKAKAELAINPNCDQAMQKAREDYARASATQEERKAVGTPSSQPETAPPVSAPEQPSSPAPDAERGSSSELSPSHP